MRLADKVGLITGGAQGIGRATAELMAKEGAKVVIVDVDEAMAQKTASENDQLQGSHVALGLKADVTNWEQCEAAVKATVDKFGKLDILVNNAGVTKDNLVMRMDDAQWDFVLDINLKGTFHFTKAAFRPMMKAHSGRIINISSVVGVEGNIGQANYAASKGGVIAFTKSCAKEFCSRNILVNCIAPGFIRTRLTEVVSDEAKKRMMDKILLGRIGEPIDIARVVVFLASEDSSYITGQVINVNGGVYV
ncbi:MAG: 3-oxoacyl-[acyl-carrier-protein] reductase [Elusimicrobia bacterium]|nr:3-oxoacyl-[acyl-carrier-protein] reductase [Elusimicrobiota bacterium]